MAVKESIAARPGTLAPETLLRIRRPLEAVLSPDGARVAFTVSASFSRPGERVTSAIWIADTEGGTEPRQVTAATGQDALPRWSPDGEVLVFASDRDHAGRMSLYLLGGQGPAEARPVGEIAGSVEEVQWAPDGRSLLVLAADIGSDRAGVQAATKIEEAGSGEQDPRVTRPRDAWRRLFRVDAATGATSEVGPEGVTVWEFDWTGGDQAAAIVSEDPSESGWYSASVALIDLAGRSARTLHRPTWQVAVPRLARDGRTVCFVESFCSDRGVVAGEVTLADVDSGETRTLPVDADVSWLEWRDGSSLWFAGWRRLGCVSGRVSFDGSVELLTSGPETLGTRHQPRVSASRDGRILAAVRESTQDPPEVALLDANGGNGWTPLTRLNAEVAAEIPLPRWHERTWAARDGLEIEGLLARPAGEVEAPLPLVVVVHGGPTGAWSHGYAQGIRLADAGFAVLLPNPRGSIGRGQEFARANLGDMGGEDLQDILAGVDALVEAGIADDARVAITGGSYGGFMAAWAVTQTDRFAASIPIACVSDWLSFHLTTNIGRFDELFLKADPYDPEGDYPARSPVVQARKCRTPTLVIHGADDLCTPVGQAQELYQALVEAGVETELVVYPREGHGLYEWDHQLDAWQRMHDWLSRFLLPERAD
jgi:dipeptidyl aminopeptidase/acylaminoacyl peptidase